MSVFNINNIKQKQSHNLDKPTIMLVDDEQENLCVLEHLLSQRYNIIKGFNGQHALELIQSHESPEDIKLIITDQRMPGINGVELLEQTLALMPDTIRIILTGFSDTQAIIDSINKVQLYKFVTKPFEPTELLLTVERGIEAWNMKQQIQQYTEALELKVEERTRELEQKNIQLADALEQLEQASFTDQLTQARNRRFLSEFIQREITSLQRTRECHPHCEQHSLGILLLDLDFFKQINDTWGHEAGDKVLVETVNRIKTVCCKDDWVIRWGGEEFLVVSKVEHPNALDELACRILDKIHDKPFDIDAHQSVNCTCSLGGINFPLFQQQPDLLNWTQVLNIADKGLYKAKQTGRDRACIIHSTTDTNQLTDAASQSLRELQIDVEHDAIKPYLTIQTIQSSQVADIC